MIHNEGSEDSTPTNTSKNIIIISSNPINNKQQQQQLNTSTSPTNTPTKQSMIMSKINEKLEKVLLDDIVGGGGGGETSTGNLNTSKDRANSNSSNNSRSNSRSLENGIIISKSKDDCSTTTTTTTNINEIINPDENNTTNDDTSNDPGKMFVGGLSWQTSAEGLRDYFCKFGDVNECMVMRDPATKRARGFGFITFADPTSVDKVLAENLHELDGKKIDPKVAFPKRVQPKMVVKTKKVFIGGLSSNSTLEDMKNYFQQYGKVDDAMLMFDKNTQRHRGFGFITFDDDDISDKVCEIHFHEINGKMVECKKAQPKEVMLPVQINKTRAAAARNLYGLAPEQLLAYASFMPRMTPFANTGVLYPALFNGFTPPSYGLASSGRSSTVNNTNNNRNHNHSTTTSLLNSSNGSGGNHHHASTSNNNPTTTNIINPRDLAAVQLAAQQQAVFDAYASYHHQTQQHNAVVQQQQQHHRQQQVHHATLPQHHPQQHHSSSSYGQTTSHQQQQQQQNRSSAAFSNNIIDYSTNH